MADIPLGFLERLDDNRLVFVGRNDDEPGTLYLAFRSRDGVDTRLKVSEEAVLAMQRLYLSLTTRDASERLPYPETSTTWKHHWVVSDRDFEG